MRQECFFFKLMNRKWGVVRRSVVIQKLLKMSFMGLKVVHIWPRGFRLVCCCCRDPFSSFQNGVCVAPLQLSRVWRSIFGMSDLDTKQPIRVWRGRKSGNCSLRIDLFVVRMLSAYSWRLRNTPLVTNIFFFHEKKAYSFEHCLTEGEGLGIL